MIKTTSLSTALIVFLIFSPQTFAINQQEEKNRHENLIAAQQLVVMGCMGKAGMTLNRSGNYPSLAMEKIQKCVEVDGNALIKEVSSSYQGNPAAQSGFYIDLLDAAVLFAKKYSAQAQQLETTDLINGAREWGAELQPYRH